MAAETPDAEPNCRRLSLWLVFAAALAFGIAHTQAPLYFSNQFQYFLHGLACGGAGFLDHDWLACTSDPTPLFSAMVAFTYRHLHLGLFYFIYLLLLVIYFVSLLALGSLVIPPGRSRRSSLCALGTMLIVVHAGIVRLASVQWLGVDYPWYFQCGVANQYVLGPGLQPSAFGVLLIASMAAFARRRLVLAIVCSSAGCVMHATYLLPAAMLTLTYMLLLYRDGRTRTAMLLGAASLSAVLPVVIASARSFAPSNESVFQAAEKIVAEMRIPHHAMINRWLDGIAGLQIGWIVLALIVLRKTRLALLLAIPFLLSTALTLVQAGTENLTLALLFPWRVSAVLMPIATCVNLAWLAARLPERRWLWRSELAAVAIAVAGGVLIQFEGLAYHMNESELPALAFVRDHKQAADVYLIPVRIPGKGPRGSASTSFTPPPRGQDKHLIVVDLQRFRLFTEAPIYVDFKSIPYKDADVLEWRRRLENCEKWYADKKWNEPDVREALRREGITHVVVQADRAIDGDGYELVYEDRFYRIYRVR